MKGSGDKANRESTEGAAARRAHGSDRPRRGAKADATRRQLLDAALKVIGEKGYSAATVDEIVAEANVSKGLAYYHFKSKAAMAECILEEGVSSIIGEFERLADTEPTASEALMGMMELFASRAFDNKDLARFFVSELWRDGRAWSDSLRGYERRLMALIEGQLARGQREGVVREDIDLEFNAVALIGLVLTSALYYLSERDRMDAADGASAVAGGARTDVDKQAFVDRVVDYARRANVRPEQL